MCGPQSGEGDADATIYVIGAGIVGLSVAWHLQRRGERVVVVDREEPARGCSFGNAGALSSGSVAPLAMPGIWWTSSEEHTSELQSLLRSSYAVVCLKK